MKNTSMFQAHIISRRVVKQMFMTDVIFCAPEKLKSKSRKRKNETKSECIKNFCSNMEIDTKCNKGYVLNACSCSPYYEASVDKFMLYKVTPPLCANLTMTSK